MADEYQVTRPGRTRIDSPAPTRPAPPASDNPEVARAQIEATRARMSETIDEIEDVLLEKKAKLREKLDVLGPVRERPLEAIGVLFGVGLALGLLTGGGDDEDDERAAVLVLPQPQPEEIEEEDEYEEDELDAEEEEAWARADLWEDRAQRLLRIARAQEEELEVHRAREARDQRRLRAWEDEEDDSESFFDRIRDVAAERLSAMIGEITERMTRA